MSQILVTGGAGFIGSYTVKRLVEKGYHIVVVDNFNQYYDPQLKKDRIKSFLSNTDFKLYEADIGDASALKKIFQENSINIVVHQAAQAGVRYSLEAPHVYEHSNVKGTLNVLECAKDFKVEKIVFASSSSVYGERKVSPFKEGDITDSPISLYAATKKATEVICHSYHKLYNIKMTGLRYFTVYGPWGRPDMALFSFTKNILEGKPIDVYGEGKMERDFTYIDDIINGVEVAVEKDFAFEIFNLGRGNPAKLTDFIDIIENTLCKKAKRNLLPMQKGDVRKTYADIKKAEKMLNFKPQTSLERGVQNFIAWYKNYYNA
jgi:UDP-glucuronate 4-epimerase